LLYHCITLIGSKSKLFNLKKNILTCLVTISLLFSSTSYFSQADQSIDLRSLQNFVLFATKGDITQTGTTQINGDIGVHLGDIKGYQEDFNGTYHVKNDVAALAANDLKLVYDELMATTVTNSTHPAVFGNGEVLSPGVYSIVDNGAASIGGALTLNAGGDTNKVFIIKINGAFSIGASASIHFVNGAQTNRVFWIAEGAISIAADAYMQGNFISHAGAVGMGDGGDLGGRFLAMKGAITFYNGSMDRTGPYSPYVGTPLSVEFQSFTGERSNQNIRLEWSTVTEKNNDYFLLERSTDALRWQTIATDNGAGNSSTLNEYSFQDMSAPNDLVYYRLKQVDFDGEFSYASIVSVQRSTENSTELSVYPNPTRGIVHIDILGGELSKVRDIYLIDFLGHKTPLNKTLLTTKTIDLSEMEKGVYMLFVEMNDVRHGQKLLIH
jgi:hypothetical protein